MPEGTTRATASEADAARREQDRLEMREVRARLNERVGDLAERLLGAPQVKRGHEWEWPGGIGVAVNGPDRGKWNVWNDPDAKGWPLDLIRWKLGGTFGETARYAREFLGMPARGRAMTTEERAALSQRLDEELKRTKAAAAREAAQTARKQAKATRDAQVEWKASMPAPADHPYLVAKQLPAEGWRVNARNELLVPAFDAKGQHKATQQIAPDGGAAWRAAGWEGEGNKRFPAHSPMDGLFAVVGGRPDPAKPMRFVEGAATGHSLHIITGEPVAITFSAGNMVKVMRDWHARCPDQGLIAAVDNDHHKPLMTPPKRNVGLEIGERMRGEVGAVVAPPPFASGEAGTDWNDYLITHGRAAARDAFARIIATPAPTPETAPMPDTNVPSPPVEPVAAPARDPRQALLEIEAVEAARLGMSPKRAVEIARSSVGALSDEQVTQRLASVAERGWAVLPDGTINPNAVQRTPQHVDPMRAAVGALVEHARDLDRTAPDLARTVGMLAARADEPGALRQENFRTRVAYAVLDVEKAKGADLALPAEIRQEFNERAVAYPGLTNQRALDLLRETPALTDPGLVREIRRVAANIAKEPDQGTPQIAERLDVLENKLRVLTGPPPAPPAPSEAPPAYPPGADPAQAAPGPAPDPAPRVAPLHAVASPGPGAQAAPAPAAPQVAPGGAAAAPKGPDPAAPVAAVGRQTVAGQVLQALRPAPPSGPPPWDQRLAPFSDRVAGLEARMADGRSARLVDTAHRTGQAATAAVERFATGPGRGLLDQVQARAATDPGGLSAVIQGMAPGGAHAGLRQQFDVAMAQNPAFAQQYKALTTALNAYGEASLAVRADQQARGAPATATVGLDRIDAALGEEAARIPGLTPGKSTLDELASRVADALQQGMEKVRAAVVGAVGAIRAGAGSAPGPSPAP